MEHGGEDYTDCSWYAWMVSKGLKKGLKELEISGRIATIQTKALLRSTRIMRKVLGTEGDLLSLKLQRKCCVRVMPRWCICWMEIITKNFLVNSILLYKIIIKGHYSTYGICGKWRERERERERERGPHVLSVSPPSWIVPVDVSGHEACAHFQWDIS